MSSNKIVIPVCPVNDVDALAAAIERMITDDKFRMTVQAGAIERSKYYSVENTMNRWEEIFNKLKIRWKRTFHLSSNENTEQTKLNKANHMGVTYDKEKDVFLFNFG